MLKSSTKFDNAIFFKNMKSLIGNLEKFLNTFNIIH